MTGRPWYGFRFHTVWRRLPAPPAEVYAVLERVEDYPRWWPQIREVVPVGTGRDAVRLRSVLPLEHRVTLRSASRDPRRGELSVELSGDLQGWVRCTVREEPGGGSRVGFEQYTEVRRPLLRWVTPLARPLLRANHALMMRAGQRGLTARLRSLDEG